jgi:hypothetical protein
MTQRAVDFPGSATELPSPDAAFVAVSVDNDGPPWHSLMLRNSTTGSLDKLLSYERHVRVEWAPAGHALALTNFEGSDSSRCLIFMAGKISSPIDLNASLGKYVNTKEDHHAYCEVVRWKDKETVQLLVHGYGDAHPAGFKRTLFYSLATGLRQDY